MQYEAAFRIAAETFLYKELPDSYEGMEEKKQMEIIESLAWSPFKGFDGYTISGYIDTLAGIFIKHSKE